MINPSDGLNKHNAYEWSNIWEREFELSREINLNVIYRNLSLNRIWGGLSEDGFANSLFLRKKPNDFTNYTCTCVHCIAHHSISDSKCQHFRRYVVFILLFFHQKPKMRDYSVHGFSTSIFRCGSASIPQTEKVNGSLLCWYCDDIISTYNSDEIHARSIFWRYLFIYIL